MSPRTPTLLPIFGCKNGVGCAGLAGDDSSGCEERVTYRRVGTPLHALPVLFAASLQRRCLLSQYE